MCRGHRLIDWSAYGDEQTERSENIVWTTNDVPFNVALFDEALVCMRFLVSNKDEALLQEMQQRMKEYQMGIDSETRRLSSLAPSLERNVRWIGKHLLLQRFSQCVFAAAAGQIHPPGPLPARRRMP